MYYSHQQEKLTIVIVISFEDKAGIIILNYRCLWAISGV